MAEGEHPRLLLPAFVPHDLCKELEFVQKSCSTVGYRPNVFSTTLSHLIATNSSHLIMPFVSIRERLKEKVEELFDCQYELFVEFTGLISWCKGAQIGWHSDDNRPYLKQRDFAVVCYLNSHGKDFKGGMFHFQDGEPATVVPMAGITEGERLTLTMWFTRDPCHDEDVKLVALFSQRLLTHQNDGPDSYLPMPASNNMYWFSLDPASPHQSGFDIRWARIHFVGFNFCTYDPISDPSFDPSELLIRPLHLAREDEIFDKEFLNSLHALQVVQFYYWKASEMQEIKCGTETGNRVRLAQPLPEERSGLNFFISSNHQLAETVLGHEDDIQPPFDWTNFSAAVTMWERHCCRLERELLISIPQWKLHQTIFSVALADQ
ncbi:2-oxoglutarate (2OG) and Fe(II)-dependent oxygenase superfamily protein isoform X2 [Tasmannia lanceolata]|uniref:2-oxoglutarate (2OG) and Fe(II)-dependent oxygenase superfamily protein isoform X2 n=1 Tax=Tasmannia lanceolata TaxID=3420 RepID=UPI0040638F87